MEEARGERLRAPGGSLRSGALVRESGRTWRLLAANEWRLSPADAEAARAVLARLTAPLPAQRGTAARSSATDRDRRLQRALRTTVHHLDAGAVSPSAAALLAAVARALLPWHAAPNPLPSAAAPRYPPAPGTAAASAPPTGAGEALLPGLGALFAALVATSSGDADPHTPPVEPWKALYTGRFRHHTRPAPGVWSAETVGCPGCGEQDGPWTVTCDWRRAVLGCACGTASEGHGLSLSEIWLVLPERESP
ncbi:hypothetical protein OHT52_25915 [Streptomyces sp. NBC_00247]|uniref:hypothetical protein n=1 Tax=Streptomyces sp. NBC_00247 TaxID=2975689 RepID=UPI002E2AE6DB|nr:hypothetical protein [Streptomyces sp. NBC_00247]